jgi:amino acid adenylation domain-containing protein
MFEKTYSSDMAAAASQYYKERDYWLKKLSGELVKTTFPIDLKAPGKKRKIEAVPLRFPGQVVEKLLWMSNESDSRLLVLLIAGLAALIQTYTDNNDIILGTPIYKQPVEGKFLNTVLPLRNRVEGKMSFKELLYQVKQTINQAVKNQNYPLKTLLYELNVPYSEEDFPLFDIALMVENIQERKYIHHIQTNMMFSFSREGNRLDGRLEYNSQLYLAATAERICSHFNRLLEQLLFHIDTPLSHIDLLSRQEKKILVEDFNNTRKETPGTGGIYQADRTLHLLFEEQVERTPDQTAIIFIRDGKKQETLTYRQLNEKANGLARVLRKNGVGPERIAALLMESSIPMVTAVLAVLKAGGAYLPIDLEAPMERKIFMLKESGARLVLTDQPGESTSFSVPDLPQGIKTLDVSDERMYDPDTTPPCNQTQSSDLAYIIYTSGSTGKPKGVLVEHGHVVNTLVYRKEEYRMDNGHTALQLFSYAFDGFLTSFFTPIISGARVVILSKQTIEDITRIVEVIANHQVTHFISVPILYQAIMKTITREQAASLQVVTLAGDQVQPHLLELTAAVNKNIEIVNEYGITEAGVMSTVYRHQEKDPRIKIGFPGWNTRIYITRPTDPDHRQLLSVGVYGEMCIAGAGVARGYMNNPGLTAVKFTADPFLPDRLARGTNGRHRRMLTTGDMARRLPDGNIEFMGRIDLQVKIRGYRIEPGEIENRLKKHQRIKEAVVIARENKKNDKYLCAYYIENDYAPPELWPSVAEFFVYDELLYYAMTHDERRNKSYKVAINRLVKDKIVVEVGTGQDAVLAKFCAEAGARKVYAVELMEESYKKARETIQHAGLEETIVCIHGDAARIQLPEKADVCISEIVGSIGGSEGAAVILNNARRFLKEDGVMIPQKSITKIAAVRLPDSLHGNPRFTQTPANYTEKIFRHMGYPFDLRVCVRNLPPSAVISNREIFESLDFSAAVEAEAVNRIHLVIHKDSRLDGFLLWLNLHTVEGEVIDILEHEHCWLPVFVPLFYPGIQVTAGDRIEAQCIRTLSENNINPDFRINGVLKRADRDREAAAFDYHLPHFEKRYKVGPFYQKLFEEETVVETPAAGKLGTRELSDYLAEELPAYMVPTYFVPMDRIPINANGKIDRAALPEPKEGTADEEYIPPRDAFETHLVEIWQDVLGIEKIGISDNFFDLGGHSLTATMLASRIHKAFNVKIPLTKIFVTPTIRGIARHIKETTETAREIFDRIEPTGEKSYYPLSSAQKRLYFLYRLEEAGRGYNMSQAVILEGDLDTGRVETVFKKMIERHESLRTSFHMENGEPVQKIHKNVEIEITYDGKLAGHNKGESTRLAPYSMRPASLLKDFIRPFDLAKAPLMRVELVELEEGKHLLMMDMHHIVTDGTSLGIMIKEFALLYKGEELPPLRIGCKDYAQWQAQTRQQAVIKEQEAYWMRTFSQEVPVLDLPPDFPRPAIKNFQGSLLDFSFAEEETRKLKTLAKEADATLYMTLLALFNILLSKLSGQEDIVIGTPTAGRRHTDVEPIVGMFINTLALRNYPLAGKTGIGFLKEVKTCTLKAFENQEYPFEDLVDRLAVRRDTGRNPIFDVLFALQNMDVSPSEISGLKLIPCDYETGISKFDLNLNGFEERNQLFFSFEYSTALFKQETIQRFIRYFREIVSSVTADPRLEISRIEILTGQERSQVLYECNDTAADYPANKTIHGLFEDQAAKTPDKIALTAAPSNNMSYPSYLSYKHLDQESNRLACLLRAIGVTIGSIVAIMVERSMEMAVGLFGILKAGGAYLPIDPEYPDQRIRYMLQDSNVVLLLASRNLSKEVRMLENWEVGKKEIIYLDSYKERRHAPCPMLHASQASDSLAYIIYTSGTTGTPRGVVINHNNVVNGLWFRKEEYKIGTSDVCLQLFSYSFDGFVTSFFTPLISGAAVVLLSEEQLADIKKIKEAIVNNKVTHFICVPPLYHAIIEYLTPGEASTLRVVTLAGDTVSPKTLTVTREKNPNMEIANEYGVTEASVVSSIYRHQENDDVIKIGKPISNTQLYILNREGRPQPKDVPGELCIGGVGVSGGYSGNPELTTEKFNRSYMSYMSHLPYLKLYRTGDRARRLPDGTIELLGRIDHQLKIRGFRIEAGEIENRLRMKEGIKEALVMTREDKNGDKYLCAYVVPGGTHGAWSMEHGEEAPTALAEELREFLARTLPGYMIPSYFISLEKFPLNPNGKIDRKTLPQPEVKTGGEYIAPSNENEEKLVQIWADVLGLEKEKIGVNDNFFDLGGNSLKVMQVSTKLKETFHQDIPVIAMFQHTTIGSFAHYLNPEQTRARAQLHSSQKDRSGAVNKGKNKLKNLKHKMKERKNGKNK